MSQENIELIPVAEVRVVNPRSRNRFDWLAIVASIRAVGLKKPILVSRRESADANGKTFDLVCGQGRLEAFKELSEEFIPAIITEASQPDQYLMSLVENIARKAASNKSIYYEVRNLIERGYDENAIAAKLGLGRSYVAGVVHLVRHGESKLIQEVEKGSLPVSVAVVIANGNDEDIQRALSDGYASGDIRGSKLKAVRQLIKQRAGGDAQSTSCVPKTVSGAALVKLYKERIAEQQILVARAEAVRDRLRLIGSAMSTLMGDEDFRTVLDAEGLVDMPEQLRLRMG
jgi:ParB family chromosome partitioning protein